MSLRFADTVMAMGPMGYFRCGDASGSLTDLVAGNSFTAQGAATYSVPGAIRRDADTAIRLNGADANYFSGVALDVDDTFTIIAWIKRAEDGRRQAIINWDANGPQLEISVGNQLQAGKAGVGWFAVATTPFLTGDLGWHMVAVAKAGATYALYIDGVSVPQTGANLTCSTSSLTAVNIGRNTGFNGFNWNGSLDEIVVFNKALTAGQIAALYVEAMAGQSDTQVTLLKFRDPNPPHGETVIVLPTKTKYSFKLRKTGTAAFYLSRTDPNVLASLDKILPNEPAMITIERPDGFLPWVGFITQYNVAAGDPAALFQASDHSWRLASPHGARTRRTQTYKTSGGGIIRDVFADMEARAEPAPLLMYDTVGAGDPANYEVRADYGLDLLEAIAKQTNHEWGFSYNLEDHRVETHLNYVARLGTDRRDEEIWQEQKHFAQSTYTLSYANGIKAAFIAGGQGNFADRPAVVVNASGASPDTTAYAKTPISSYGLGGTRATVMEQVTDKSVLQQHAVQMHEAPEYAVEQFGLKLFEPSIDMSRFQLGDIRTIRLASTSLGSPIERVVRVIGIQMDPDSGLIDAEVVAA